MNLARGFIVGGSGAKTGEIPFLALIGYKTANDEIEYQCGGALINKYAIHYVHLNQKCECLSVWFLLDAMFYQRLTV